MVRRIYIVYNRGYLGTEPAPTERLRGMPSTLTSFPSLTCSNRPQQEKQNAQALLTTVAPETERLFIYPPFD